MEKEIQLLTLGIDFIRDLWIGLVWLWELDNQDVLTLEKNSLIGESFLFYTLFYYLNRLLVVLLLGS